MGRSRLESGLERILRRILRKTALEAGEASGFFILGLSLCLCMLASGAEIGADLILFPVFKTPFQLQSRRQTERHEWK